MEWRSRLAGAASKELGVHWGSQGWYRDMIFIWVLLGFIWVLGWDLYMDSIGVGIFVWALPGLSGD